MPMDILLLPRDGARINMPLSAVEVAALDVVATAFNGGRNHDGRGYQMQMLDGGYVDLSDDTEDSAGMVSLRNWDEQRADFVFQVMKATDRVAVLISQSPAVVLSHQEEVLLDDAGYEHGSYSLRLVTSAADVLQEVERSLRDTSDVDPSTAAPAVISQENEALKSAESWSAHREQVLTTLTTSEVASPPTPTKRGVAALLVKLLKGGRA
jgi:hypothetical protein